MSDHERPPDEPAPAEGASPGLDAVSAELLDALAEAGFEPDRCALAGSPEADRLAGLLSLLETPLPPSIPTIAAQEAQGSERPTTLLVDVTMARVLRAGDHGLAGRIRAGETSGALTPEDGRAVDELVDSDWNATDERSEALLALLSPIAQVRTSPQARASLVQSTLARIQSQIDSARGRFRMAPAGSHDLPARPAWTISDLTGVAAALLLCASVFWPMFAASREQARATQCSGNLARAALGFSLYAGDYRGDLPRAQPSFRGGTWWDVGQSERSHSANLYILVRSGYASLPDLSCPGNPAAPVMKTDRHAHDWRSHEEISYSYQLPGPGKPGWGSSPRLVVLADKSPVVQRARRGEAFDPLAPSRNHAGRGQNVLFADGSVRFYPLPILDNGDNIWLPGAGPRPTLTGRESPIDDQDAFVGP
jgi:prepilin-type processing-associated H-X9-DG protein